MRGVFDQYSVQENQLTHALMSAFAADSVLAIGFLRWINVSPNPKTPLCLQQSLPGEMTQPSEEEAERRGLPDGVIYEPDRYTVLLESKVASAPTSAQLKAHLATAQRKGFANPRVVLITVRPLVPAFEAPWLQVITWSQLYAWLKSRPRSFWSLQVTSFLEAKEARWSGEKYLREGTLTTFAGIPFDDEDEPYDYFQAKRLIKLLRRELLANTTVQSLQVDLKSEGRAAIKGRREDRVWDMIPIKARDTKDGFTQNVHLTFAILRDALQAYVTIPNSIRSRRRTKLLGASIEEFGAVVTRVTRGLEGVIRRTPTARPSIVVVQRVYRTQSSIPERHAELRFDPRTFAPAKGSNVKHQPQWFVATYDALKQRKSNLQLQVGMDFPYATCPEVRTPQAADLLASVWAACRPILDAVED